MKAIENFSTLVRQFSLFDVRIFSDEFMKGFFAIRANSLAVELWESVYASIRAAGGWDQGYVNDLIGAENLRNETGVGRYQFTGLNGMKVSVLEPTRFWGFHMGWMLPEG
jgi:hypothetical protein